MWRTIGIDQSRGRGGEEGHYQPRRAKGPPRRPVRRRLGGGLWKATSTRKSAGTAMEFALRLVGVFVGVERIEKAEGGDTGGVRSVTENQGSSAPVICTNLAKRSVHDKCPYPLVLI